jgi:hypothetical protein
MVIVFILKLFLIQLDPACFNIFFQKLKHADASEFLENLWKIFRETQPGCKVGVASFRIEDGFGTYLFGVLNDAPTLFF